MGRLLPLAAAALGLVLGAWGVWLDRTGPLSQAGLWSALQVASLGGAVLGALVWRRSFRGATAALALGLAVLLAWRISYFPIMVFSGHIASIAEWIEKAVGLPIVVYSVFLLNAATLHALAGLGAAWLLRPPHRAAYAVLIPAFAVATAVSFSQASDFAWLPDRARQLAAPVPPLEPGSANPYLPRLGAGGHAPHVNVMLLAAGLTYETIPDAPWARGVRAVLENSFNENPVASTQDRVVEHYLAYHSAHARLSCRHEDECPLAPDVAAPSVAQ